MRIPTVPEVILEMLFVKAIGLDDAKKYLQNWRYFENQRQKIETDYSGKWVASVNSELLIKDTKLLLESSLDGVANARRAYVEHVGRAI